MGATNGGTAKGTRAALYARVSTTDQRPEVQVEELRRLASQRGWEVVGEYVDVGHSGAKDRRPELDRLLADVRRGKVDIVVVWKFDRFARSVRHLVLALEDFRARGIDFVSLHDGIDTSTPAGRFTFHVIAAVAELEREMIRERTRAGMEAARRRGAKIGRPKVRIDLGRVAALRKEGLSPREIASNLRVGLTTMRRALRGAGTSRHEHAAPSLT